MSRSFRLVRVDMAGGSSSYWLAKEAAQVRFVVLSQASIVKGENLQIDRGRCGAGFCLLPGSLGCRGDGVGEGPRCT